MYTVYSISSWKPPLREHWNGDIVGYYVGHKRPDAAGEYFYETVEFFKEHKFLIKISFAWDLLLFIYFFYAGLKNSLDFFL